MLRALHINHYILIDSLDVTFPEGLIIITGQTGAGKSILLGALSLLTGAKADASVISEGAESCVVEAEFSCEDPRIRSILEENEVEWEDGTLLVRRVVHRSGRSRSFVNDCPVPVGVLSELSSRLVDIHSQHQSLILGDPAFRLSVLDLFAGNGALLEHCRQTWRECQRLRSEWNQLTERLDKMAAERDYQEARYRRLEEARLRDGELEELEAEQTRLANAEEIKQSLSAVGELLSPSAGDRPGLVASLKEAARQLSRSSVYLPELQELSERLEASRIELDDVLSEVERLDDSVELSPRRLEAVEERMSLLYDLLKKYDCATVGELIAARDALSEILFDSEALEERRAECGQDLSRSQAKLEELYGELHAGRLAAAPGLSAKIGSELHYLELDRACFQVVVEPAKGGEDGADAVRFLFSSTGKGPSDVAHSASGGELSRIMLCLKATMARFTRMPTMIFDEIDSGVSGSVADKMGSMICSMGEGMQVFAITHLPQVAAKGQVHFLVSKDGSDRVTSHIKKLSPEERVLEIARMLSGSVVTDEAVANARRLLND